MKKVLILLMMFVSHYSFADATAFNDGPLIKGFGKHAKVNIGMPLNKNDVLKVAFDVGEQTEPEKLNRYFNSLARFLNMHAANGYKSENIQLALVVHGKAGFDLLNKQAYQAKYKNSQTNPNQQLLEELMKNNVRVYLCGQSANYYDINNEDMQKGVSMALSAMTAHSILQKEGYSLNPF